MLEDGDFRLTESSAILKYLADKHDLPSYPKDSKKRAQVNEVMDWLNTQFFRDFGYGLIYPQLFPNHKRRSVLDDIVVDTCACGMTLGPGFNINRRHTHISSLGQRSFS
jgi:hypothetical protein